MEIITLATDIKVFYVTASSYPDGITDAHQKLHSLIPFSTKRKFLGISRPEQNAGIVYRAGAEEIKDGEADSLHLDTLVLRKGQYVCLDIKGYRKDVLSIGRAFQQLLKLPDLDPQGYCVEWYYNDQDVRCMIRLDQ